MNYSSEARRREDSLITWPLGGLPMVLESHGFSTLREEDS